MNKKQTNINIVVNIIAFAVQIMIGFYTAPVLIRALGTEAYGFIGLANDFVTYISIITAIFNSVVARFISFEMARNNVERGEQYFNSILAADFCLAGLFSLAAAIVVPNIDRIINVPKDLILDVKITFLITFLAYILGVITSIFTTAAYVKNRLDIQGSRNIIQSLVRLLFIVIFLNAFQIRIYWVSAAALIAAVVVAVLNINITRKIMPEIHVNIHKASWSMILELVKSGGWMAFTSLSAILMRGLDLLVANLMLGSYDMGLLSVARTFPNYFSSIINTIAPIFSPVFIALFAVGKMEELREATKASIKSMALILFVPLSGFLVFSGDFYTLWLGGYSSGQIRMITALSTVTVIQSFFDASTSTMAQMSVVTNKLKAPVFVSFFCGLLNVTTVFLLLKFTGLGVYAIVTSSTVIMVLRYVIFNSFYCAHVLGLQKREFIPGAMKTWITVPVLIMGMLIFKYLIRINSWSHLMLAAVICGGLGYIGEFFMLEGRKGAAKIKFYLQKLKNIKRLQKE